MAHAPHCFAAALLIGAAGPCLAEVKYAADNGFHIEISREVAAPPVQAYAQFLRVGEWWNGEHSWFGEARNFSIEPRAGGCFCEVDGERSVLHMLVTYVDPPRAVRMIGGLGPLQGMGLHGAMSWNFEPLEGGGTRIVHGYRVTGYDPEGLQGLAAVVDGVQSDQVNRLAARIDGKALGGD